MGMPAITHALLATMLAAGGAFGEVEGIAWRISLTLYRVELLAGLAAAATVLCPPSERSLAFRDAAL